MKGPRDKIYVGSPNGFFEINKTRESINRIDINSWAPKSSVLFFMMKK